MWSLDGAVRQEQQIGSKQLDRGVLEVENLFNQSVLPSQTRVSGWAIVRLRYVTIGDSRAESLVNPRELVCERIAYETGDFAMLVEPSLFQESELVPDTPKRQVAQSETGDTDTEQEEKRDLPTPK